MLALCWRADAADKEGRWSQRQVSTSSCRGVLLAGRSAVWGKPLSDIPRRFSHVVRLAFLAVAIVEGKSKKSSEVLICVLYLQAEPMTTPVLDQPAVLLHVEPWLPKLWLCRHIPRNKLVGLNVNTQKI